MNTEQTKTTEQQTQARRRIEAQARPMSKEQEVGA
jgi:hypothetical protein